MLTNSGEAGRTLETQILNCDLAITGGGMAGACCAIASARAGLRVVLIQDRPVLGGNASSEVRLWILGATSHMGNNNRWAREGGVIDEILVENMYRNREGNPCIFDALMLEKVSAESNITLLLNTAVYDIRKSGDRIDRIRAFCSQNQTQYDVYAPLFCDASGDGVIAFLAGAAFRMGAESRDEFGELFAPPVARHELLGHSIYFYSRDTGQPVTFVPPSFALKDITAIPRYRSIRAEHNGCNFWWLEYGGELDTIRESETIKWELWKIVYGVWNYIKNSGKFPESANLTLEWVGMIPGKRESRRFEGDMILTQQDIVEQRHHEDVVAHGGWAIDLHPKEGVYSEAPPCTQWHAKGIFGIPYRCYYSRNVENLFLAGRIISASHVAFGSTRVMATCAAGAQAVAAASAVCLRHGIMPREAGTGAFLHELQRNLVRSGQHLPGIALEDSDNLALSAELTVSSRLLLGELPADAGSMTIDSSWAMMIPVSPGLVPNVSFLVDVLEPTTLELQLRISSRSDNHTPDTIIGTKSVALNAGTSQILQHSISDITVDQSRYAFLCLMANPHVKVHLSGKRITGVLSVAHKCNTAVAKSATQSPPPGIGINTFEFWYPERRPGGRNLAMQIEPPLDVFGAGNVRTGPSRPTDGPNAWVAALEDPNPQLTLKWNDMQRIKTVELVFDTDFDHPMESLLLGHPENVMPFCVREFQVADATGKVLAACSDNHQTCRQCHFDPPAITDSLVLSLKAPGPEVPAALFSVRVLSAD